MSIKEYQEGEHSGGFIGLCVRVCVRGKPKQKYFSFKEPVINSYNYGDNKKFRRREYVFISRKRRKDIIKEAKKQNEIWIKEQKEEKLKRKLRIFNNIRHGGIEGVTANIQKSKSNYPGRYYFMPYFYARGQFENVLFAKRFYLSQYDTYADCWEAAVKYYCKEFGIRNYKTLIAMKPDKKVFHDIASRWRGRGYRVPRFQIKG